MGAVGAVVRTLKPLEQNLSPWQTPKHWAYLSSYHGHFDVSVNVDALTAFRPNENETRRGQPHCGIKRPNGG